MELIKVVVFVFVLFSCGAGLKREIKKPQNINSSLESYSESPLEVNGVFINLDNPKGVQVKKMSLEKTTVVFFTSEGCLSCIEEHQSVQKYIDEGLLDTNQVDLISYLIGFDFENKDDLSYAGDIYSQLGMSWNLGSDYELNLFKEMCPEALTPCIVMINSKQQEVVFNYNGVLSQKDFFKELENAKK